MSVKKLFYQVWLYLNNLTTDPNDYTGRVKLMGIADNAWLVKVILEEGSELNAATLLDVADRLDRAAIKMLKQGWSVNTGVYQALPNLNGVFDVNGGYDPETVKVGVSLSMSSLLRQGIEEVGFEILGVAKTGPFIGRVEDVRSKLFDSVLTPGGILKLRGNNIKIEGTAAGVGLFLIKTGETETRIEIAENEIALNNPSQLTVGIPSSLAPGEYAIEIVTQYGISHSLKEPRSYRFEHLLTVMAPEP